MTTDNESSRPIPLNSATVMNESMLATDVAEARGRSLAIAALMSLSKLIGTGDTSNVSGPDDTSSPVKEAANALAFPRE
jgi:hypothetical protein